MATEKVNWPPAISQPELAIILREEWQKLAGQYCDRREIITGFYDEIHDHYSEPSRHYHNLQHIVDLFCVARKYEIEFAEKQVVSFAIVYHDIIYNPGSGDNEEKSAVLAGSRLKALGVPAGQGKRACDFILATKQHELPLAGSEPDLALFLDLDMCILATEQAAYDRYTAMIRNEFEQIPAIAYYQGRRGFLLSCLRRRRIFLSGSFSRFEQAARENMQRELKLLAPGL